MYMVVRMPWAHLWIWTDWSEKVTMQGTKKLLMAPAHVVMIDDDKPI